MLAVQQQAQPVFGIMAEDKQPAEGHSMFGYSIDPDEPPLAPPEPPLGAPLLTHSDTDFLSNFLDNVGTDQYNATSFGEGLGLQFNNDWFNFEFPPQFMGTRTSFGQQTEQLASSSSVLSMPNDLMSSSRTMSGSQLMPPPPPPPAQQPQHQYHQHHQLQNQQHSADILNAAAALASRSTLSSSDYSTQRRPIGPPVGHLRHQPLEEFQEDGRRSLLQNPQESGLADWMHGPQGRKDPPRQGLQTELQWGSDSNFIPAHGYTPDMNKETVESMHRDQMRILEALEVSKSAASTRPSSPSAAQPTNHPRQVSKNEDEAPPRKRRKSKNTRDGPDYDDDDDTTAGKANRRRKVKTERAASEMSPTSENSGAGKRRKSGLTGAKAPRENLSEAQKRENHIRSEQKRRTLIKEGFDDLCEMVPALASGGFSKSAMLTLAADWLEDLLKGNSALGISKG